MQRNGKTVYHDMPLDTGLVVGLRAENIRQQSTGLHARISVSLDGQSVTYDTFNIEREKDRIHLVGSAWKRLEPIKGIKDKFTKARLQNIMDEFCQGVWPLWTERLAPEELGDDDEIKEIVMLLAPYIIADGAGTIAFAKPGAGKTYTALAMAVSIDAGCSQIWPVRQTKVAYLNLERSRSSFLRRLKLVNVALGLPMNRKLLVTNARGWSLSDVVDGLESIVESKNVGCVFVDSLSRAGYGDLNNNDPANKIMDALNGLGVSWFAIGHTARGDETHVFGSQMFDAAADVAVQFISQVKDDGTLGVGMKVTKSNDIAKPPLQAYALEFDKYGLAGIRAAEDQEFLEVEAERAESFGSQVKGYLLDVGNATATDISEALGFERSRVAHLLKGVDFIRLPRDGRRVPYGLRDGVTRSSQVSVS